MSEDHSDFNLDERILCPDDTCIGIIGPDGRCKICKTPYSGELPTALTGDAQGLSNPSDGPPVDAETPAAADDDNELLGGQDRRPCPDDTCIGIIGPDGTCGTCGRSAGDP